VRKPSVFSSSVEELFEILSDPKEERNLLSSADEKLKAYLRKKINDYWAPKIDDDAENSVPKSKLNGNQPRPGQG
jgi:hypothetical protein